MYCMCLLQKNWSYRFLLQKGLSHKEYSAQELTFVFGLSAANYIFLSKLNVFSKKATYSLNGFDFGHEFFCWE